MQIQDELKKLAEFQKFDLQIQAAKKVLRFTPLDLKNLESDLLALTTKMESLQWQLSDIEKQKTDLVNAIQSDTKLADQLEVKLPTVISVHKEYHNTAKHIDKLRKLCKDRFIELDALNKHHQDLGVEIAKTLEEKCALEKALGEKKAAHEAIIQERTLEISAALKNKEEFKKQIAPQFLQKYERLSTVYGHGVGIVKDMRCGSCNVLIPQQIFIKLQRGEEILECPNCMRLLCLSIQ